ncbi:MAG: MFS transporter [Meiothermus sp.]|nr:MFS transporter [Meiothermus sp.]
MNPTKPSTAPWAYALGEFGLALPTHAVGSFLIFFYTDQLSLAAAWVALARSINAVWDAVNDPLFGYWSDRTRHSRGRRWPWLRFGLPLYVLCSLPLWWVPEELQGLGLFIYFLFFLVLFEALASLVYLNFNALFPALYPEEDTRVRVNALRRAAGLLGLLAVTSLSPLLFPQLGFGGMGLVWAGLAGLGLWNFFSRLHEPAWAPPLAYAGFWANLLDTLKNPDFRLMLAAVALTQTALGLLMLGFPFFARYALELPGAQTGVIFGGVFGVALVSAWVWPAITRRLGARQSWQLAMGIFVLALLPLWLLDNLAWMLLIALPLGFALSGVVVLQDVVLAQVIDQDAARSGLRREGAFYGIAAVLVRLSGVIQNLILASLTPLFGYVSGDQPGPAPETAFRFLMAGPPVLAMLLSALVVGFIRFRQFPPR